jgi:hypothetical protein
VHGHPQALAHLRRAVDPNPALNLGLTMSEAGTKADPGPSVRKAAVPHRAMNRALALDREGEIGVKRT